MRVVQLKPISTKQLFHINNNIRLLKIANDVKPVEVRKKDNEVFNQPIQNKNEK